MKDLTLKFTDVRDLTTQQENECSKYDHLGVVIVRNSDGIEIEKKLVPVVRIPTTHNTYRVGSGLKRTPVSFDWVSYIDPDLCSAQYDDGHELSEPVDVEVQEEYVEVSHINIEYWDFDQLDEE